MAVSWVLNFQVLDVFLLMTIEINPLWCGVSGKQTSAIAQAGSFKAAKLHSPLKSHGCTCASTSDRLRANAQSKVAIHTAAIHTAVSLTCEANIDTSVWKKSKVEIHTAVPCTLEPICLRYVYIIRMATIF